MIKHCLNVSGQKIYGTNKVLLASDANQTVGFKFNFDSEWKKLETKAAVFQRPGEEMLAVEVTDSFVLIPWEILAKAEPFFLSVIAYSGQKLLTTQKCVMAVSDSALPQSMKPGDPTEDIFSKLKRQTEEAVRAEYAAKLTELESELAKANEQFNYYKDNNATLKEQVKILEGKVESVSQENTKLKNDLAVYKVANTVLQERAKYADEWDAFWEDSVTVSGMFNLTSGTRILGKEIPYLNTANVVDASRMIGNEKDAGCNVRKISMRCDKAVTIAYFAANNRVVTDITLHNLSNSLVYMPNAFSKCVKLKNINGEFDLTNIQNFTYPFEGCVSLEKLRIKKGTAKVNVHLGSCESLNLESLLSVLDSLSTEASGKMLVLSSLSKVILKGSDFSYNDGENTYYGEEAYYWAVIDKGWSFSGWSV